MSERFAGRDVREMNFDDRNSAGANGVVKSDGCVGVSGRIKNDADETFISSTTDTRDEFTFVVGLHELDVDVFAGGDCSYGFFDVGERGGAVDGRFAFSEPVEIRSGDDENATTRSRQVSSLSNCGARVRSM